MYLCDIIYLEDCDTHREHGLERRPRLGPNLEVCLLQLWDCLKRLGLVHNREERCVGGTKNIQMYSCSKLYIFAMHCNVTFLKLSNMTTLARNMKKKTILVLVYLGAVS